MADPYFSGQVRHTILDSVLRVESLDIETRKTAAPGAAWCSSAESPKPGVCHRAAVGLQIRDRPLDGADLLDHLPVSSIIGDSPMVVACPGDIFTVAPPYVPLNIL